MFLFKIRMWLIISNNGGKSDEGIKIIIESYLYKINSVRYLIAYTCEMYAM